MYLSTGARILLPEEFPVDRLNEKHYCKYCNSEHEDWRLMDRAAYLLEGDPGRIILCGQCEHTSRVDP